MSREFPLKGGIISQFPERVSSMPDPKDVTLKLILSETTEESTFKSAVTVSISAVYSRGIDFIPKSLEQLSVMSV